MLKSEVVYILYFHSLYQSCGCLWRWRCLIVCVITQTDLTSSQEEVICMCPIYAIVYVPTMAISRTFYVCLDSVIYLFH